MLMLFNAACCAHCVALCRVTGIFLKIFQHKILCYRTRLLWYSVLVLSYRSLLSIYISFLSRFFSPTQFIRNIDAVVFAYAVLSLFFCLSLFLFFLMLYSLFWGPKTSFYGCFLNTKHLHFNIKIHCLSHYHIL